MALLRLSLTVSFTMPAAVLLSILIILPSVDYGCPSFSRDHNIGKCCTVVQQVDNVVHCCDSGGSLLGGNDANSSQ